MTKAEEDAIKASKKILSRPASGVVGLLAHLVAYTILGAATQAGVKVHEGCTHPKLCPICDRKPQEAS